MGNIWTLKQLSGFKRFYKLWRKVAANQQVELQVSTALVLRNFALCLSELIHCRQWRKPQCNVQKYIYMHATAFKECFRLRVAAAVVATEVLMTMRIELDSKPVKNSVHIKPGQKWGGHPFERCYRFWQIESASSDDDDDKEPAANDPPVNLDEIKLKQNRSWEFW